MFVDMILRIHAKGDTGGRSSKYKYSIEIVEIMTY